MRIEFEKIALKNFLSYGNIVTEIKLNEHDFMLISGENGTGKSTLIVDAISFALFGKIHRKKITQKQVINNVNKKGCEITLQFTIDGKTTYVVKRGLKPNFLELLKDGKPMDSLSSAILVQKELDRIIQMDSITFKNVSVLSVNTSKPFVDLEPSEARSITENLMGLKIYSLMLDIVKKRIKDTKDILTNTKKDYSFTREFVVDGKEKLKKYKELEEKFEKEKEEAIKTLEKELKELESQIKPLKSKLVDCEDITKQKVSLDEKEDKYESLRDERVKLDSNLETLERDIRGKEKEIKFFEDNSECPTCASEMDDSHRQGHIKTYKKEIIALDKKVKANGKKQGEIKGKIVTIEKEMGVLKPFIRSSEDNNKDIENDIRNLELKIGISKRDIKKRKEDTIDNHISGLIDKAKIKEYIEKYKKLRTEKESLEDKYKQLTALKTVLSDEGVKASAIKKDLPFLNSSIKKYMMKFGKDFWIEFSETFDVELKGFSKKGLTYYTMSSGEKKSIDLSVLLSFIDMTRNKNSVHTNIIVMDEICDSSLDAKTLEIFIEILQNKVKENQLKNVFIVSHNPNISIDNCERITCYKDGQFSKIKYEI